MSGMHPFLIEGPGRTRSCINYIARPIVDQRECGRGGTFVEIPWSVSSGRAHMIMHRSEPDTGYPCGNQL